MTKKNFKNRDAVAENRDSRSQESRLKIAIIEVKNRSKDLASDQQFKVRFRFLS